MNSRPAVLAAILLMAPASLARPGAAAPPHRALDADFAVCAASQDQTVPQIVPDGSGGAIVTWMDRRGINNDIYAQRISATGAPMWTANGVAVCTDPANQNFPTIASDGAGGAIVTWYDLRNGGGGSEDIYAQRVSAAGIPQWATDGVPVCMALRSQNFPTIVADGAGGAIITWRDVRSGIDFDLYAQRVNSAGVMMWTGDGVPVCVATGDPYNQTMVSDGAGGAIVTWHDFRPGPTSDIYAQRVSATGTSLWALDGVAVCALAKDQANPTIASDGAGGAIVTWEDYRGTDSDIYAQRISAAGVPQWTANGLPVCAFTGSQLEPNIVSSGAGGAIVTWYDYRDGPTSDIYAQRISAAGAPQWTAGGEPLCTASNYQLSPRIAADGAGGAIVTWTDARNSSYDVYVQHIDAAGVTQWIPDGMEVCVLSWEQSNPAITAGGAGGAIVAWQDYRSEADFDIYALVVPSGVSGVEPAPTPVLSFAAPSPNPARGNVTVDYALSRAGHVRLSVYDPAGRRLEVVVDREQSTGAHRENVVLRDDAGGELASGLYLLRLEAEGRVRTRSVAVIR